MLQSDYILLFNFFLLHRVLFSFFFFLAVFIRYKRNIVISSGIN